MTKININKKALKISLLVLMCALLVFGLVTCGLAIGRKVEISSVDRLDLSGNYKNVILMIGDGMGFNHVAAGAASQNKDKLFMQTAAVQSGDVTTYSWNFFGATDSAAAATALATGQKTDNGMVGRYAFKNIENNVERAIKKGMATGVIATEGIQGATPACFSAHADSRNDKNKIFSDQLVSGINLFMGGNKSYYDDNAAKIAANGYSYINGISDWDDGADKLFGAFDGFSTSLAGTDENPTLADVSVRAMNYLSAANDKGFFLMIEESHIDKRSHSNDMSGMLEHVKAYDEAIKAVVNAAKSLGDTIVIATADHETGGLRYNGESASQLTDKLFTRSSHSSANVPYFIYFSVQSNLPKTLDNTQLAQICRFYIENR